MKYIVHKPYWDFEKEEAWLNEMSARGMALSDYSWCRYVFTDSPNSQYIYRIELLDNLPTHPESIAYLRFLEENGVECVASYMRWVYLRKNAADGPFDIYTDIDSKIKHYQRINLLWSTLMIVEFIVGGMNVAIGIINLSIGEHLGNFSYGNIGLGVSLLLFGLMFLLLGAPLRRKIKKLRQEKTIHE
ncbi:hypothetical protein SDC9_158734 [bioreactor metagenome]|jgi:hypothetical protein|uniref:DUF2812 domain-containing protein n=1 Tax=bioreactor metagenome TaxID=1076179 RepID=A0A645FGD6_9ZZZZ|nr:DUF2812 domain-containing protein [Clostridia bacterium]